MLHAESTALLAVLAGLHGVARGSRVVCAWAHTVGEYGLCGCGFCIREPCHTSAHCYMGPVTPPTPPLSPPVMHHMESDTLAPLPPPVMHHMESDTLSPLPLQSCTTWSQTPWAPSPSSHAPHGLKTP